MANLLILDDESMSRTRLCEALSLERGHNIAAADSVQACRSLMNEMGGAVDLLIIDASVAAAGDFELLQMVRDVRPRRNALILTHSMQMTLGTRLPVLCKPFSDAAFVETVNRLLHKTETQERSVNRRCVQSCA